MSAKPSNSEGVNPASTRLPQPQVALVHDWLTGMRGGEKVLQSLASLYPGAPIYTLLHTPGCLDPDLEERQIHTSFLQSLPGASRHYRYLLPSFPAAIESFDLTCYDLIVSSSHCVAKGVIPGPNTLHVCYCHTPMRYAWDQEHIYFPRRQGPIARLRNLLLSRLRTWDAAAVPRVDHFVANSSFVAQRIRRYYGRDALVIPPPVDVERFADPNGPNDNFESNTLDEEAPGYCLAVSALAPYKRVDLAIAACAKLGLELRIVGEGPERSRLEKLAGPRCHFLGRVSGGELVSLYRNARLFLQPGLEDFGIASVEALAAGTPAVALGQGGIRDIVEDGRHGVLYDPAADADALADAIDKALKIRFNPLELKSRAQLFSANRFAERFQNAMARWIAKPKAATT